MLTRSLGMASDNLMAAEIVVADGASGTRVITGVQLLDECIRRSVAGCRARRWLRPYVSGAYIFVPNVGMAEWETAHWGANFDRRRTIKT